MSRGDAPRRGAGDTGARSAAGRARDGAMTARGSAPVLDQVELGRPGRNVSRMGLGAMPLSLEGRPEREAPS